jgi:hypothetical protein
MNRGSVTPRNNIGSREPPSFRQRRSGSADQQNDPYRYEDYSIAASTTSDLPPFRRYSLSPASTSGQHDSQLGDSSSLLYKTPPSSDFWSAIKSTQSDSPIPFVFGASSPRHSNHIKMVNERSPAKALLHPVAPNEQPSRQAETSLPAKPPQSSLPQFGQPTLPQSPLNRPPPKQSSVFIQPKSRPEHHRDGYRPGMSQEFILQNNS